MVPQSWEGKRNAVSSNEFTLEMLTMVEAMLTMDLMMWGGAQLPYCGVKGDGGP